MSVLNAIFFTLGTIALLESAIVFIFPKATTGLVKIINNKNKIKKAAAIELIVAIILILIAINL